MKHTLHIIRTTIVIDTVPMILPAEITDTSKISLLFKVVVLFLIETVVELELLFTIAVGFTCIAVLV